MIVVFIGPPYAGKNTQGQLLSRELGDIPIFSMGALIREARERGEVAFIKAYKEYSLKGLHLPTAIKFPLLREEMDKVNDGFVLENFPATEDDLIAVNSYLKNKGKKIDKVIYLKISEDEMKKRFHEFSRGRADDDPHVILVRKEIQDKDRIPVINYYKRENLLLEINGEGEVNKIHGTIMEGLRDKQI